jgi:CDP-6-deoxy-D-xylo-4-hexulose-3-dehydrase
MSFPFLIDDIENRRKILEHFNNFGIQTRPILSGNFFQQVAAKNKKIKVYEDVLNAKKIHQHGFMIGNHHSLSDNQVQVLIDCIESIHT